MTTLGSGVDGSVRRVETAYDTQGNAYLITSYDAASGGNVVNQVQRTFNGLGQLKIEYQSHSGAVDTGSTPKVQYTWSEMPSGANHSRLVSITYPNGKVLTFNYATGLNNNISRVSSISDTSGTLESYDYLGVDTVVRRAHAQPGVDLTYIKQTGESTGDAGDQYTGLDRFGRVVDQRWRKTSDGSHKDRFQYGYDRDSNPLYRDNLVNSAFGELYSYDDLNQLTSFYRGTLNANKDGLTGSASRSQDWDFDALGNFDSVTTDSVTQTRAHDAQNEITSISGATTPTYDANGNLTGDETGRQFVYDAWNRLVTVKDSGGSTISSYQYDGLGRRISETQSGTTTDLYVSTADQVLEERVSGTATVQYVWSPVYVDALVLRDRDTDANGSLDERRWVQQDANWNVTALLDNSGAVVERYAYDPYGNVTIYDASWSSRSSSSYGWVYQHQGLRYDGGAGLYHARARDLSPSLGRWLQNDPAGFGAGDVDLYRAYGNGPTGALDPGGMDVWIEGPSAKEPFAHQSLNVGDPLGEYSSYSFGRDPDRPFDFSLNGQGGLMGNVYRDTKLGGKISQKHYIRTTKEDDAKLKHAPRCLGRKPTIPISFGEPELSDLVANAVRKYQGRLGEAGTFEPGFTAEKDPCKVNGRSPPGHHHDHDNNDNRDSFAITMSLRTRSP